ncbi:MAG: DUF1365 domain-containing protein [Chthoniobacterales bacterium]
MNSCFYECKVLHRRLSPRPHEFLYRIFFFYLDLDELAVAKNKLRIFGVNQPNIYSFQDSDHLPLGASTAKENVLRYLQEQGCQESVTRVCLLTLPRLFGYVFNPISIYFCFDAEGSCVASVAEVSNTFREMKPYFVPRTAPDSFHSRQTKYFYVSPFSELDLAFDFRFQTPDERLQIYIDDYKGDEKVLLTSLTGQRTELSFSHLLAYTLKYPLITLRVIFLIHFQAFILWLKRLPHYRKEANPDKQRDLHNPYAQK